MKSANNYYRRKIWNSMMLGLSSLGAGIAIIILALIIGYTVSRGASYINLDFFTQAAKPVGEVGGGMRNEIIGTLLLVALATLISVPVGLMAGIFLSDTGNPRLAASVRFVADILTGVPSIVVGVFAYAILVRPMHSFSAISAGVALAIIMVPVIARTAEESMRLVPNSLREAALALGITRWRAIISVVLPGAVTGIITGAMLGIARIAGETAPLLFTALGNAFGFNGLDKPVGALPLQIWNFAMSPYADWQQQAWAASFLLIIMILVTNVFVRWISARRGSRR